MSIDRESLFAELKEHDASGSFCAYAGEPEQVIPNIATFSQRSERISAEISADGLKGRENDCGLSASQACGFNDVFELRSSGFSDLRPSWEKSFQVLKGFISVIVVSVLAQDSENEAVQGFRVSQNRRVCFVVIKRFESVKNF